MNELIIRLNIPPEEFENYYRGIQLVQARSIDGRSVQFPARMLRPFVSYDGVRGVFRFRYNSGGKIIDLVRLR